MDAKRRFIEKLLASGLENSIITTDDVLKHANPKVLAEELPVALKSKLLGASLTASAMTSRLVVDTLGTPDLAEHLSMHVLWACIEECGARALGDASAASALKSGGGSAALASDRTRAPKTPAKSAVSGAVSLSSKPTSGASSKPNAKVGSSAPLSPPPAPVLPAKPLGLPKRPSSIGRGAGATSKRRASTLSRNRAKTSPASPSFVAGADSGDLGDEEDWGVEGIVEVVEEESRESGADWKPDDETATRDP